MSNTVQNGKGDRRRVWDVENDNWNLAFKREKKNVSKNRYKRGQKFEKQSD